MGKRKGKRRNNNNNNTNKSSSNLNEDADPSQDSDAESVVSWADDTIVNSITRRLGAYDNEQENDSAENQYANAHGLFVDNVLRLELKSKEKRCDAMENMLKAMRSVVLKPTVSKQLSEVLPHLQRLLGKGSSYEQYLACDMISTMSVTLGVDAEELFVESQDVLCNAVKNADSPGVRSAAMTALSLTTLVACEIDDITDKYIQLFEDAAVRESKDDENHEACSAALNAWSALVASRHDVQPYEGFLGAVKLLLEHRSQQVKVAAGHCVGLLFDRGADWEPEDFDFGSALEKQQSLVARDEHEEDQLLSQLIEMGLDETALDDWRDTEEFSVDDVDYEGEFAELVETLGKLAIENNKREKKRNRSGLRSVFREIRDTVKFGGCRTETLRLKNEKIVFANWGEKILIREMRNALGTGLQTHLLSNELLMQMFDYSINVDTLEDEEDVQWRKEQLDDQRRERQQKRSKDRLKKTNSRRFDDDDE
eukprot:TRINITY_DN631_c0_g1_i10.p1 TRINITY_DN631_c0_g1~~TRINITY_DN631_c0_g1_i10.p1  ORF type:complete len:482 (-),score=148.20 TRINITY_DN631_c0_g1_i10:852-2297(-)